MRAGSTGRCNTIQRVDSTMLAKENHLFGCDLLKPSQGSLSTHLTLASDSSLYFHCRLGSSKCCVDLLRPPRLPLTCCHVSKPTRLENASSDMSSIPPYT